MCLKSLIKAAYYAAVNGMLCDEHEEVTETRLYSLIEPGRLNQTIEGSRPAAAIVRMRPSSRCYGALNILWHTDSADCVSVIDHCAELAARRVAGISGVTRNRVKVRRR